MHLFEKTMENVTKHRNIKFCNNSKKKKLFSIRTKVLLYKVFTENLLTIEMKILMNNLGPYNNLNKMK